MTNLTTLPNVAPDPVELIRSLDAHAIRARLEEMERERMALLALLRAATRAQPTRPKVVRA